MTASNTRLEARIREARSILATALEYVQVRGTPLRGTVCLFSGGNDSTVLAHLFREDVTHYAHANTGIGIEAARQFVRDCATQWNRPLLEFCPRTGQGYEDLVLGQAAPVTARSGTRGGTVWRGGFPGPSAHGLFFSYLKGHALAQARRELISSPRRECVIYLTGIRREESLARSRRIIRDGAVYWEGSTLWVSPLHMWTSADLTAYRKLYDCPVSEPAAHLHISGECLCGCYARGGQLDEVEFFYPETAAYIRDLESRVAARDLDVNPAALKWGWRGQGRCRSGICNI